MFFSFTKNNGTDRDKLSLDIVNFREGIFFMTEVLYHPARDVRLLIVFIYGFRAFTVECSGGSRRGGPGGAEAPYF